MKEHLSIIKRLISDSLKEHKRIIAYFVCFTIGSSTLPALYALLVNVITASLTENGTIFSFGIHIAVFGFIILACTGAKLFCQFKADTIMTYIRMTFSNRLNAKMFDIPYSTLEEESFFAKNHQAFTSLNSSEGGVEKICNLIFYFPSNIIALLLLSLLFVNLSPFAPFLVLIASAGNILLKVKAESFRINLKTKIARLERKLEYIFRTTQNDSNNKELRLYDAKDILELRSTEALEDIRKVHKSIRRYDFKINSFFYIFYLLIMLLFYFTIVEQFRNGLLSIAHVLMYTTALVQILLITENIASDSRSFISEHRNVAELFDFLYEQKPDSSETKMQDAAEAHGQAVQAVIKIEGLSFRYPNSAENTLKNINIKINKGEKIAIVGLNGAGKSTLIKCLTGLYKKYSGTIELSGVDLQAAPLAWVSVRMGALHQDVCLYAFSLRENIASASEGIDEEKVKESLEKIGLSDLLANSLDSTVFKIMDDQGLEFSGGQKQKVAFSRLLYKQPEVFILDEPTSALDSVAEESLLREIEQAVHSGTCIFVTHRLPSIKHFDRIVVMHEGLIVEEGEHAELMSLRGQYYKLYTTQQAYYEG